ncbi:unnamed protein product, partial [Heterobilharzia americana]
RIIDYCLFRRSQGQAVILWRLYLFFEEWAANNVICDVTFVAEISILNWWIINLFHSSIHFFSTEIYLSNRNYKIKILSTVIPAYFIKPVKVSKMGFSYLEA